MRTIFFMLIGFSSFVVAEEASRFIKDNTIVIDNKTGLEWQDDYSDNANIIKSVKWIDAIAYCEELSLNNQDDWRLPNKKELFSIVDYSVINPAMSSVFQEVDSGYTWSSTSYSSRINEGVFAGGTNYAYYLRVSNGIITIDPKYYTKNVRCVRGG